MRDATLTAPILSAEEIEAIASGRTVLMRRELVKLCDSHERLRAELAGAEKIIEQMDRKQRHGCTDAFCQECDR